MSPRARARAMFAVAVASLAAPFAAGTSGHGGLAAALVVGGYVLVTRLATSPDDKRRREGLLASLGGTALVGLVLYAAGLGIGWASGWRPPLPVWLPPLVLLGAAFLATRLHAPRSRPPADILDLGALREGRSRPVPASVPAERAAPRADLMPAKIAAPEAPAPASPVIDAPPAPEQMPVPDPDEAAALEVLSRRLDRLARQRPAPATLANTLATAASKTRPEVLFAALVARARDGGAPRDRIALNTIATDPDLAGALADRRAPATAFETIVAAGCEVSLAHWIEAAGALLVSRPEAVAALPDVARMTAISRELEAGEEAIAERLVGLAARVEDILLEAGT